jgi:hypothetical protein
MHERYSLQQPDSSQQQYGAMMHGRRCHLGAQQGTWDGCRTRDAVFHAAHVCLSSKLRLPPEGQLPTHRLLKSQTLPAALSPCDLQVGAYGW